MNLELPKEAIDRIIEELNKTVAHQSKHFLRLSSQRDMYSIPQASFRLNVDRHLFESEFVDTGKIKIMIRGGKRFVAASEIEQFIECEPKFYSRQYTIDSRQQNKKQG
ncbi:MAG: hypothetical protein IPL84_03975 [Chitinophagaceae bacterium]|nr:hypothetical protein [Chitinophagaceae bacterium]